MVDEAFLDKVEYTKRLKNLSTATIYKAKAKGKNRIKCDFHGKFILCSNNLERPVIRESGETRFWVIQVPKLKNDDTQMLEKMIYEIPSFLYFLTQRQLSTSGHDRLWFRPEETRTEAWRRIVAGGMTALAKEMATILMHIMDRFDLSELKYDAESLYQMIVATGAPYNLKCACSRIIVRDILRGWGLGASKTTVRFNFYVMQPDGIVKLKENRTGKVFSISRELLKTLSS